MKRNCKISKLEITKRVVTAFCIAFYAWLLLSVIDTNMHNLGTENNYADWNAIILLTDLHEDYYNIDNSK